MKISLKNLNLKQVEKLTREQLKNVMGGNTEVSDRLDSGGGRCKDRHTYCGSDREQGTCESNSNNRCVCNTGTTSWLAEECVA